MRTCVAGVLCWALAAGLVAGGEYDVPGIAYGMMRHDLDDARWSAFCTANLKWFETWQRDNPSGNFKRFLDDKLLERAPGVLSGKTENLQKFIYWLALYHEFREPPPWYIRLMARKHGAEFADLLDDFSWDRFAARVQGKAERLKQEERSRVAEAPGSEPPVVGEPTREASTSTALPEAAVATPQADPALEIPLPAAVRAGVAIKEAVRALAPELSSDRK
ncbi:MAG: hypothetical protein HS116_15075 [Planctomycetes bacterium]|nr:hypothetical protein [Planctomycetota bacterium]